MVDMDNDSSTVTLESGVMNYLPEKKKLAVYGILLVVFAALMIIGSSVSLNLMMEVTTVKELFSSVAYRPQQVESTLVAFRVIGVILILLAILQLMASILYTAAVVKDKVDLIYRYNVRCSLVTTLAACCFWVLTMTIIGTQIPRHKGSKAWMTLFLVGVVHASIIVNVFTTIQTQRKTAAKKAVAHDRSSVISHVK